MSRHVNHQFATFWFALNEQLMGATSTDAEQAVTCEKLYPTWKKACELIEAAQAQHPLYRFQELHSGSVLDFERWEYCEQDGMAADVNGQLCWSISFHRNKVLPPETLVVLRDLCVEGFAAACTETGCTARLARVETSTEYTEMVTAVVEGL